MNRITQKSSAAGTAAALAIVFLTVYWGCAWITSRRGDVGTWYFEWERHIPFVPVMILPYMSIDALFVAAPFVCRDERERRVFATRIVLAVLVAGACFLLMPLRLAVDRPAVEGWLGAVFAGLGLVDRPFNLFPSLHIAFSVMLSEVYVRRSRGLVRVAWVTYFVIVGLSTLLTYQHHIIDMAGGAVLAGLLLYLVPEALGDASAGHSPGILTGWFRPRKVTLWRWLSPASPIR